MNQDFKDNAELIASCQDWLAEPLEHAAHALLQALMNDGKILLAGNGMHTALADVFAAYLVASFRQKRMNLAAMSLCGNAALLSRLAENDESEFVYSAQVQALGKPKDILCVLSADGNCSNLLTAIQAAHERDMCVLAMTGNNGGKIAALLRDDDSLINIPHDNPARILEIHLVCIHALCRQIDGVLLEGL
ncbi:SIS domain-containing protein [Stenoxybacter acetivorans]|uniref:SIS domain-containing protein n=1 Tax=Stenoxybacter acetivorans TaxID=422441 RepID=UPI00056CE205|nr:SIS domain-containing protein [Stenoxybacter acetivorans]